MKSMEPTGGGRGWLKSMEPTGGGNGSGLWHMHVWCSFLLHRYPRGRCALTMDPVDPRPLRPNSGSSGPAAAAP